MIVFKNFLNMSKYDCFLRYYSIVEPITSIGFTLAEADWLLGANQLSANNSAT